MGIKLNSKTAIVAVTATAVAAGLGNYIWKEEHRPPILEVHIFALKGGQSVFIRTPEDKRMLINGGANSEIIRRISSLLPFYSRRIDSILSTNDAGNNVSGLVDVVDRYKVDRVYIPSMTLRSLGLASTSDPIYGTFLKTLKENKVAVTEIGAGDAVELDRKVKMNILFPAPPESFSYSKASAPEIVFQISYGSVSISFLGDATKKIQKFIGTASSTLTAASKTNVLIVSHSGAPDNLSAELIDQINPQYFIYSKATGRVPTKTSSKKKITDPLDSVSKTHRYNVEDTGEVRITSDGVGLTIEN